MKYLIKFFENHRQLIFNIFLFIIIGQYVYRETELYKIFSEWRFIDITFFIHNIIFLLFILLRKEYIVLDKNILHWAVAVISFFSNLMFIKSNEVQSTAAVSTAEIINFIAIIFGIITLLNLGRSFGIVPAVREVKTGGVYRFIRHPMYVSDFLFKLPLIIKYFSIFNAGVLVISVFLYILRAGYEEKLLLQYEDYREYAEKVKYCFIPLIY
jgi:protein-S-isoprenylcysteine O-methyltransferase Ste14